MPEEIAAESQAEQRPVVGFDGAKGESEQRPKATGDQIIPEEVPLRNQNQNGDEHSRIRAELDRKIMERIIERGQVDDDRGKPKQRDREQGDFDDFLAFMAQQKE